MDRPDLYAVLGLTARATQAQISHAYRALLRQHHPDTRAPGDPSHDVSSDAALQQVLRAYAVLGDPARRADYDRRATVGSRPPTSQKAPATSSEYRSPGRPPIVAGPIRWRHGP